MNIITPNIIQNVFPAPKWLEHSRAKVSVLFLVLLSLLFGAGRNEQFPTLPTQKNIFPFREKGLWGYIDSSGSRMIPPIYLAASRFTEGLAAVREEGKPGYGYIDQSGKYMIEARFDYAEPFKNGLAKVYLLGKPYFIDSIGKIVFEHPFVELRKIEGSTCYEGGTASGKAALLDAHGNFLTDTIYGSINDFVEGIAIVTDTSKKKIGRYDFYDGTYGAIDTAGIIIVPLHVYSTLKPFQNGFAIATKRDSTHLQCVLDRKGKIRFGQQQELWRFGYAAEGFSDGLAIIEFYAISFDSASNRSIKKVHAGVIDTLGNILFHNPEWEKMTSYSNGRAFVELPNDEWIMIDKHGKQVGENRFMEWNDGYNHCKWGEFYNGRARVKRNDHVWAVIDTTGNFVPLSYQQNPIDDCQMTHLFYAANTEEPYIIWNSTSNHQLCGNWSWVDRETIHDDLIRVVLENNRQAYINQYGKTIWMEQHYKPQNDKLNIDFMNSGYCYASSFWHPLLNGIGGWGKVKNRSNLLSPKVKKVNTNSLQLIIDTSSKADWFGYQGCKIYLANFGWGRYYFRAQNSRLYIKLQAKTPADIWKDIEYIPSSFCGNSYHAVYLPSKHYWAFKMPTYHGTYATKIRAIVTYKAKLFSEKYDTLYSNEIDAQINLAQFWRRLPYFSTGIMDPYDE